MVEKIEINLIPHEYRVRTRRFTIKKDVLIPIVISGVLISTMAMWNTVLKSRIRSVQQETTVIENKIRKFASVKREIEKLGQEQAAMETKIAGLKQINVVRDKWVRLLELYCREIPNNTWLTQLTESGSTIKVKGETNAFGEVGQFMVQLMDDSLVNSVKLVEVKGKGVSGKTHTFSIEQGLAASMISVNNTPAAETN